MDCDCVKLHISPFEFHRSPLILAPPIFHRSIESQVFAIETGGGRMTGISRSRPIGQSLRFSRLGIEQNSNVRNGPVIQHPRRVPPNSAYKIEIAASMPPAIWATLQAFPLLRFAAIPLWSCPAIENTEYDIFALLEDNSGGRFILES